MSEDKDKELIENVEKTEVESVADNVADAATVAANKKKRTKKIVGWVFTGLGLAIVAFLLFVVIVLAVDKFARKSPIPSFFGNATLIVTTGSMSGTIEEGDMIIVKAQDGGYKIGDIVTYIGVDGVPTTHRIIRIDGEKFYTRGDANSVEDPRYILEEDIFGKVTGTIPYVGLFFRWFAEDFGWLYMVAGIAVIAAGVVLVKYFAPKKEKKS